MEFNSVVVKILLNDVSHAPIVDLILCIDEALDLQGLWCREEGEFLRQFKLVCSLFCN